MCSEVLPGACCHYCGGPATTRDHIVPRSRIFMRPAPGAENLVPACSICNLVKGDLPSTCRCQKCLNAWYRWGPMGWHDLPTVDVIVKGNNKRAAMKEPLVRQTGCRVWEYPSDEEDARLRALQRQRRQRMRRMSRG